MDEFGIDGNAVSECAAGDRTGGANAADEMIQLMEGRAAVYRMIASLFWAPFTQEQIDALATNDLGAVAAINDLCAQGANDVARSLRKRNTGTRRELASDFTSVFGGTHSYNGRYATPYESLFTSDDGAFYADAYRSVYKTFKKERLKLSDSKNYPEDHLSFMCEFLAVESDRVAQAIAAGDAAAARAYIDTSREFLAEHVLSWFPRFKEVAYALIETRFYRGVMKIAEGLFNEDAALLDSIEEVDILDACGGAELKAAS